MRILVNITHPAHVHLFKNMIWGLQRKGHEVKVAVREKDAVSELLNAYGIDYEGIGEHRRGLLNKGVGMLGVDYRLYKIARKFRPDILTGMGSMYAAHVSKLIGKPCILFEDTERSRRYYWLYAPFAETILTPYCFKKNLGPKQIRYNGFHELAYLHPNYFKPDSEVLSELNLSRDDKFIILRFVSWSAVDDFMQKGFSLDTKRQLIRDMEDYGQVLISSEGKIDREFKRYEIDIPSEKIHSVLYFAQMYIGEGATMAAEAGILGTPSLYVSSLASTFGNFEELQRYGLVYSFKEPTKALEKASQLLEDKNQKKKWYKKERELLKEKIDVTRFMIDFIERYPESFHEYRRN